MPRCDRSSIAFTKLIWLRRKNLSSNKIFMELYGYFGDILAGALVGKPGVVKVWANQHQFHLVNHLYITA
jgi:hypothetical protein